MINKNLFIIVLFTCIGLNTKCMYIDGIKICRDGTWLDPKTGKTGNINDIDKHDPKQSEDKSPIDLEDRLTASEDLNSVADDTHLERKLVVVTLKKILAQDVDTDSDSDSKTHSHMHGVTH